MLTVVRSSDVTRKTKKRKILECTQCRVYSNEFEILHAKRDFEVIKLSLDLVTVNAISLFNRTHADKVFGVCFEN